MLDTARNRTLVETKLREMGFTNATVRFVQAASPEGWAKPAKEMPAPAAIAQSAPRPPVATAKSAEPAKPAPIQLNKDDFKNDPLIKKALEVFKGTIVEVRA